MRRFLSAAAALLVLAATLTAQVSGSAAPGGQGCKTVSGTANLMSDRGSHVLGTYTHTVQFCWDWIGTPSNYSITSAKRTYSMKLWPDDKFCAHDPFSQWGRFSSGGNSLKKKSVKLWESTMGQNLVRNYFVRTYQDDHKCTYKYQGQLQWRPRVTIDLVLPHPKVRAPAVYPNR